MLKFILFHFLMSIFALHYGSYGQFESLLQAFSMEKSYFLRENMLFGPLLSETVSHRHELTFRLENRQISFTMNFNAEDVMRWYNTSACQNSLTLANYM